MAAYFEFLNYPKIVSGQGALENIPSELDGYDAQKPLVVAGTQVVQRGLIKAFLKAFSDSIVVVGGVYDRISDYAGITQALQAADLFKARGCDAIIALGNGPVMDVAKAVNVLVSEKVRTLKSYRDEAVFQATFKPLVVVPSCCFNGWEATDTMTVDNRRITSEQLYPQVVILDARMLGKCPSTNIIDAGVITLAHAYTALTSDHPNPMVTAMAHPAMRLLCDHWVQGVHHSAKGTTGLALANAAVISQAAFSNTGPGLIHQLAEAMSKETGIPLSNLIFALLPAVLDDVEANSSSVKNEFCLATSGMERYAATPRLERAQKSVAAIRQLVGDVTSGGVQSLKTLKVQEHLLDKIAQCVSDDSNGLFNKAQCLTVLTKAWRGDGRQ